MSFANIILPLPLENKYTYRIPQDLEGSITSGCRVIVSFGAKHFYTGLVAEVVDRAPTPGIEYKEIYALLDSAPVLRRPQLRFWEWIASYYICKLGDVYKAALPSGLKLESETTVTLNPDFEADAPLKPTELSVLDALSAIPTKLTASDLARRTGLRNILPILSSLMAKGAIRVGEELRKGYTRKTETFVRIAPRWATDDALREAFRLLQRSPKQEQLLLRFLDLSQALNPTLAKELSKQELLEKSAQSIAVLNNLVKRGILEYYEKEVSRLQRHVCRLESLHPLTGAQQVAYEKILDAFRQHETCLLHGATSSGKTELYIHLIDQVLRAGRQVLYLLPEIAVTTQITERLARVFGDRLLVYHSKFSDNERVEVWNRLLHDGNPLVVLGVRSALFLPFKDLGLIIVDEEHEGSYKQQDPAHFAIQTMHGISPLHPPRAFLQIGIDHSEHGANLFGSPARRKNACRLVNRQDAIVFEQDLERRTIPLCFPLLVFLDFHMPARFYQILGLPYYAAWHRHAFRNTDAPVTNHLFQMSPGCLRKSRMENLYQGSLPLHINPHGRLIVLFLLHSDPRTYTQEYRKRNFPSSQSTDDISTTIYADRPESGEPYKHRHKGSTLC